MAGLDRTKLKIIAIIAMVCDHIAWGFVEFMSPMGQVMHIIGRFTLPIMCYFVAEGFRHTASKKRYIMRMAFFSVVSMLPFYLFFGELYEYRQNIIFDLLLGLLLLAVLEERDFCLWKKIVISSALFLISAVIGGWVIMPMLYILVFYYVKGFKKQAIWFCGLTVFLQVFLIVGMLLNQQLHFSHYQWPWYDKLYLLGFMLPLILLKYYNGQKGKEVGGRYFFYFFYPAHFLTLAFFKKLAAGCSIYEIYVGLHVISLLVCLAILFLVLAAKPSRGQSATVLLVSSGCIYTFGFLVEITSGNVGGFYAATLLEYFGECLLMVAFTMFVAEMCHREIPLFIYALEVLCGILILWLLFTTRENGIFYTSIASNEQGPFPRLSLEYGIGFLLFVLYLAVICICCMVICIISIRKSTGVERKRILCMLFAVICPWLPNAIRATGITGGYEVPCLGIMGAVILVGMALIKYGYFDSIALAGENALQHGQEGIMVVNNHGVITYLNQIMCEVFEKVSCKQKIEENETLKAIMEGKIKNLELEDKIYELRIEPLEEGGYLQGKMLWLLDVTKHHEMLEKISDLAHKDSLSGLFNRNYFISLLEEHLETGGSGSLYMMDLHHFRQVNDRFGHQVGDKIIQQFGEILRNRKEDSFSCRMGGDEFCLFYKDVIELKEVEYLAASIVKELKEAVTGEKYEELISVSLGIARILEPSERKFERLYSNADKALYVAKNRSDHNWYIL